jgi:hypothetical protein
MPAGTSWVRSAAGVMLVLCVPSLAGAQTAPPQDPLAPTAVTPPVTRKPAPQHLTFGLFVTEGLDFVNWTDDRPGVITDNRISQNSAFSGFSANLGYSQLGDQKSFTAGAGADLRYYSLEPGVVPSNFYGGAAISTRLSKRVAFRGSGNFGYSPFYSFGSFLLPSSVNEVRVPSSDQNISRLDTYTSGGSGTLFWMLNNRSSIYGGYTLDYVTTPNEAYRVFSQGANAGFQRQMTKYLNLRLGYGYRRSEQYVLGLPYFNVHTIDTGIGYRRPISSSRRTTLGFNAGSSLLSQAGMRAFTVTGDASLTYQMKRTWSTGVFYQRSISKVGGLLTPFVTDSMSGNISGLWSRRFGFTGSGGLSLGSSALLFHNTYDSFYGSGRFHYELSRHLPVYVEYVYYQYEFSQSLGLAPGFPMSVRRSGIRGGIGWSTPLVGQRLERQ